MEAMWCIRWCMLLEAPDLLGRRFRFTFSDCCTSYICTCLQRNSFKAPSWPSTVTPTANISLKLATALGVCLFGMLVARYSTHIIAQVRNGRNAVFGAKPAFKGPIAASSAVRSRQWRAFNGVQLMM